MAKKLAFFAQSDASYRKKIITALDFEKTANFIAENYKKIAENCDHNK
jgi:hypothetical protein